MKGIVFREFVDMVESTFSPEVLDQIILRSDLPSGGAYTSVGTYHHSEMEQLVTNLSSVTGTPVPDLLRAFGSYLFKRFATLYPEFFQGIQSSFQLLSTVESIIHPQVLKLYPDAELPKFTVQEHSGSRLVLQYHSSRHLGDLAEGLIAGCIEHFNEPINLDSRDMGERGIRFSLQQCAA